MEGAEVFQSGLREDGLRLSTYLCLHDILIRFGLLRTTFVFKSSSSAGALLLKKTVCYTLQV